LTFLKSHPVPHGKISAMHRTSHIDVTAGTPAGAVFTDLASVEAWDAWFRWREGGVLRDMSIDSTWQRVAGALASVESPEAAAEWTQRFHRAFANWTLLPDERVLAGAGCGRADWNDDLAAVVNVAAFVRLPLAPQATLDIAGFVDAAGVAVRALDDALTLTGRTDTPRSLRIGYSGFADALALLDIPYDSSAACELAADLARRLAEATTQASAALAVERGACGNEARTRDGTRVRHETLTALQKHPRLALLANNIADGVEPLPMLARDVRVDGRARSIRSHGYAIEYARRHADRRRVDRLLDRAAATLAAHAAVVAAVSPWFDVTEAPMPDCRLDDAVDSL
jgi:ribonucleoside-diphosphate reductase alpha chain